VVASIVVSFVLYSMVSGLIDSGSPTTHPIVAITPIEGGTDPNATATLTVTVASSSYSLSQYRTQIRMDGIILGSATPSSGVIIAFGDTVRTIVRDSDGKLGVGDVFFIYGLGGAHAWRFNLLWGADDYNIDSVTWSTP